MKDFIVVYTNTNGRTEQEIVRHTSYNKVRLAADRLILDTHTIVCQYDIYERKIDGSTELYQARTNYQKLPIQAKKSNDVYL